MTSFVSAARADGPDRSKRVVHGFLDGPRPFFGSYHVPNGPVRDIAWVVCPPLGWEGIQSYETVNRLADELAAAGFHTLRLHYDGTGESIGSDDDPDRVAAWLESIRRAIAAMAALPGVSGVALAGVRVGATLAGGVASDTAVRALVLWEPCVSGAQYTREMEILASASPRAIKDDGAPASRGIEAGGYLITPPTASALATIDLLKSTPKGDPEILILARDDRPPLFTKKLADHLAKSGAKATLEQLPGYKELMTYPEKAKPGTAMIERTRAWAVEHSSLAVPAPVPVPDALGLQEEARSGTTRRRPIRFGPNERIFGVLTEPTEKTGKRPVLLLTGGVVPRTAVNRMYVDLAVRLAEKGHTVLRMDVSGICESAPADGAAPNDPHAQSLLDDVRTAVELLLSTTRTDTITMLGLCSGAYASFQTALADPRVKSITLLNPEVFHLKDGSPKFSETEQSHAAKHYREQLLNPAAWKKLLSGKANVRYLAGFAIAKAKSTASALKDRVSARVSNAPKGVAGDIHALLGKGVKVQVVMAENDSGYESLMGHVKADLEMLERAGFVLKMTPGPDHTFNDFSVREPLVDWLVERLST